MIVVQFTDDDRFPSPVKVKFFTKKDKRELEKQQRAEDRLEKKAWRHLIYRAKRKGALIED